jgi:hypothetical protein
MFQGMSVDGRIPFPRRIHHGADVAEMADRRAMGTGRPCGPNRDAAAAWIADPEPMTWASIGPRSQSPAPADEVDDGAAQVGEIDGAGGPIDHDLLCHAVARCSLGAVDGTGLGARCAMTVRPTSGGFVHFTVKSCRAPTTAHERIAPVRHSEGGESDCMGLFRTVRN